MIDQQTLTMLQQLMQKNRQDQGGISAAPNVQPMQQQQTSQQQSKGGTSALGFLGGMGNGNDANGNYQQGIISQLNHYMMNQQASPQNQILPWQQSPSETMGSNVSSGKGISILSALLKFL